MKFKIVTEIVWQQTYAVEAETEEDAVEKFLAGDDSVVSEDGEYLWDTEKTISISPASEEED